MRNLDFTWRSHEEHSSRSRDRGPQSSEMCACCQIQRTIEAWYSTELIDDEVEAVRAHHSCFRDIAIYLGQRLGIR